MAEQLPPSILTAYHDLIGKHDRRPAVSRDGSPLRVERGGRAYWVLRRRQGGKVVEDYLGPETAETLETVERVERERVALAQWRRDASSLVSVLRSARCLTTDRTTGTVLRRLAASGFFARGGVLGGTHAFRAYPLELGVYPPEGAAYTDDIDLVAPNDLSLAAPGTRDGGGLIDRLEDLVEPLHSRSHARAFRWSVGGKATLEVLAPLSRSGAAIDDHPGLGVAVQRMKFLEYALVAPIEAIALFHEGIPVRVPSPQRFALHKLLVSQERSGRFAAKKEKDLAQAHWLIDILAEDRPADLAAACADLLDRGPGWRQRLHAALRERPPVRAALEEVMESFAPDGRDLGSLD